MCEVCKQYKMPKHYPVRRKHCRQNFVAYASYLHEPRHAGVTKHTVKIPRNRSDYDYIADDHTQALNNLFEQNELDATQESHNKAACG